jgi:DNA mismatch repair protein MutS2
MEAGRISGRGIEWDAVRRLLAHEAQTTMGRERALTAEPLSDPVAVQSALEATSQARLALAESGAPPFDVLADVRPILDRCRLPGSVLDGPDLVALIPVLEAGPRLAAWGRGVARVAGHVAGLTDRLPRETELRDQLRRSLDPDGNVADEASPLLRRLRREIRERRRKLVADLERMAQSWDDRVLADRFVTVRYGRYVLPVRADARSRVRGIVHDRSQSGQTFFIEPADVVEANNEIVQRGREEEAETARVLAELTGTVRARLPALDALVESIGVLDWLFARAALAERMGATAPALDAQRTVALRAARHPLLLAQSWQDPSRDVVPVDLELSDERPLLLVTGPNAGGKTIALKTLALHALMAQTGCHLPAAEGSRLPVFRGLHAIVGDDQSVAENLSTFSAFVKQVRAILAEADEHALVLLDELGAGTDPDEGAALAQAILEELAEAGSLVMATTHLEPLKTFANTHPRARNASVEFDTATLTPTFRLRYDVPGPSYALTIAARLGLSAELIRRAEGHRSAHAARLAELLNRLDAHTRTEAERTLAMERRESEAAARLAAARETEAAAQARAREVVERARAEASGLLGDVRRTVNAEWDRLKRAGRTRRDNQDTRRRLNEAVARIHPAETPPAPEEAEALVPGARVVAEHLGLRGEIVAVAGGTATVRAGSLTVRVPVTALRGAGGEAAPRRPAAPARAAIDLPDKPEVNGELHLLGRTTDEARDMVEQYLDDAFMAGLASVRLVHGKGTGALRKAVRDLLSAHPLVESFREGAPGEGGSGATVAALKVS